MPKVFLPAPEPIVFDARPSKSRVKSKSKLPQTLRYPLLGIPKPLRIETPNRVTEGLFTMPEEIIINVFLELASDPISIVRVRMTCKRFQIISNARTVWLNTFRLRMRAHGLVESSLTYIPQNMSTLELEHQVLQPLRQERAWRVPNTVLPVRSFVNFDKLEAIFPRPWTQIAHMEVIPGGNFVVIAVTKRRNGRVTSEFMLWTVNSVESPQTLTSLEEDISLMKAYYDSKDDVIVLAFASKARLANVVDLSIFHVLSVKKVSTGVIEDVSCSNILRLELANLTARAIDISEKFLVLACSNIIFALDWHTRRGCWFVIPISQRRSQILDCTVKLDGESIIVADPLFLSLRRYVLIPRSFHPIPAHARLLELPLQWALAFFDRPLPQRTIGVQFISNSEVDLHHLPNHKSSEGCHCRLSLAVSCFSPAEGAYHVTISLPFFCLNGINPSSTTVYSTKVLGYPSGFQRRWAGYPYHRGWFSGVLGSTEVTIFLPKSKRPLRLFEGSQLYALLSPFAVTMDLPLTCASEPMTELEQGTLTTIDTEFQGDHGSSQMNGDCTPNNVAMDSFSGRVFLVVGESKLVVLGI